MDTTFTNRFLAEDVERAKRFRLLDDDYLTLFFSDTPECMALVLNIIFERDDMVVTEVRPTGDQEHQRSFRSS